MTGRRDLMDSENRLRIVAVVMLLHPQLRVQKRRALKNTENALKAASSTAYVWLLPRFRQSGSVLNVLRIWSTTFRSIGFMLMPLGSVILRKTLF